MKYLALILILITTSCAPRAIPVVTLSPVATNVKASAVAAQVAASKVVKSTEIIKARTVESDAKIAKAVKLAAKLSSGGTATKEELSENDRNWRELWAANTRVLDAAVAQEIDAKELEAATKSTVEVSTDLVSKTAQADASAEAMRAKIDKDAGKVAMVDGFSLWTKIGIAVVIIALVGFVILKFTVKGAVVAAKTFVKFPILLLILFLPSCAPKPEGPDAPQLYDKTHGHNFGT